MCVGDELILDGNSVKSIIYANPCMLPKHLVNMPRYHEQAEDACLEFKMREATPGAGRRVGKPLKQRQVMDWPNQGVGPSVRDLPFPADRTK